MAPCTPTNGLHWMPRPQFRLRPPDLRSARHRSTKSASTITAPTQFLQAGSERYAYRRFGSGPKPPLLCLQHFTGTLDNWDPAVTDPLATEREVILFENAGIGRSSGSVPTTVAGMAVHALAFLEGLKLKTCDVLGFSLGGMVAQQMALERPSIFRKLILVGTGPRGGEDITLPIPTRQATAFLASQSAVAPY